MMDLVLRIFIAGVLGGLIGLEREYRGKAAGFRTHFLVALGSALFMVLSMYGFEEVRELSNMSVDPSRCNHLSKENTWTYDSRWSMGYGGSRHDLWLVALYIGGCHYRYGYHLSRSRMVLD